MVHQFKQNHFFEQLNQVLQQQGLGVPQLILDRAAFQHNIHCLKGLFEKNHRLKPRFVVKSIANLSLLAELSEAFNSQRYMVFHLPHLLFLLNMQPQANILMGKPMPIQAVALFYQNSILESNHDPKQSEIHWLVDTLQRVQEYLDLAKSTNIRLYLNIEIDVGLHRGGVQKDQAFLEILSLISAHPEHLIFTGCMGYDAHITKLPTVVFNKQKLFQKSQSKYRHFQTLVQSHYPRLNHADLIWNGGGSPTLNYHCEESVCNDLSFGSVLFKPLDFVIDELQSFQHALFIAAPVLKVLDQLQLPALEKLSTVLFQQQAVFIYGGFWLADYVYPKGIKINSLYGRSSNQELVTVPKKCKVTTQDYAFLIPNQSEAVIQQFRQLSCYDSGQFNQIENLRE